MIKLPRFKTFLSKIDLKKYRNKYKNIKIVEMNMPKNIQALDLLYKTYWVNSVPLSYEVFYKKYKTKYSKELKSFRKKTKMCLTCFSLGLPARIYRTWTSIITQIHAGYVAEKVFGKKTVDMSTDLDHEGADFQVTYKGKTINFQVKKNTFSSEVRAERRLTNKLRSIKLEYKVPGFDILNNPKKKNGEFKKPYLEFKKIKCLDQLPNGFIIFNDTKFKKIKKEKDA